MDAKKHSVGKIFDGSIRLIAPLFQRPYVWNEERNWQPLWESVQEVADRRAAQRPPRPHFLGTVVLDQVPTTTGAVETREIIDGQQRLTTLQLLLAVARDLCQSLLADRYQRAFGSLVENNVPLSDDADDVYKVWPTNADQPHFRRALQARSLKGLREAYALGSEITEFPHLMPAAYAFFERQLREWVGELDQPELGERLGHLFGAIRDDLQIVVIDLETTDDAQVIFETLNALGTPLLPADLVKNFLFHRAEDAHENVPKLYVQYWKHFDDDSKFWRTEVRQGRLNRPRVDLFLQHLLALLTKEDVGAAHLFSIFREYVASEGKSPAQHLEQIESYSRIFRRLSLLGRDTPEGVFLYRLDQLDTNTVYPLLLEAFRRFEAPDQRPELRALLRILESYLVRRTVCRLTTKAYNRLFLDLLKETDAGGTFSASGVRGYLLGQTAESSRWPTDEEFEKEWNHAALYKAIVRKKLRMILEAVESQLHTGLTEKVLIDETLTVEHLMPQGWRDHWPLPAGSTVEDARARDHAVHRLGNLSLLTKKLNPTVSNGAWTKKRDLILSHSALNMNRPFGTVEAWDETYIDRRGKSLLQAALTLWPRP
jgi:hypothetical protein